MSEADTPIVLRIRAVAGALLGVPSLDADVTAMLVALSDASGRIDPPAAASVVARIRLLGDVAPARATLLLYEAHEAIFRPRDPRRLTEEAEGIVVALLGAPLLRASGG